MRQRIFIHANNVHQGGGRSLLLALLKAISDRLEGTATLDQRLQPLDESFDASRIRWVAPSAGARLASERWLAAQVQAGDVLLCFGNLPPLFRSRGHVIVFMQNRYLLERLNLEGFSCPVRLRIWVERWWLRWRATNVDLFVVQTPTMKTLLQAGIMRCPPITVLPFSGATCGYSRRAPLRTGPSTCRHDFLYVASGEPHKNHRNLIEAWCLLAQGGSFPSLCLTVGDNAADLCRWIEDMKQQFGLRVENLGTIPHEQVLSLCNEVRALVFASTFESFGLPLIEARQAGLPVLAPELDYVRDILDPEQTFDPRSPVSIARAIKRFLGVNEEALPLLDAAGFVDAILSSPARHSPADAAHGARH